MCVSAAAWFVSQAASDTHIPQQNTENTTTFNDGSIIIL